MSYDPDADPSPENHAVLRPERGGTEWADVDGSVEDVRLVTGAGATVRGDQPAAVVDLSLSGSVGGVRATLSGVSNLFL